MAFGSHVLRFQVKHRQVTKRFPRAHLGSRRNDDLGFIVVFRRFRPADEASAQELQCNFLWRIELISRRDDAVVATLAGGCD